MTIFARRVKISQKNPVSVRSLITDIVISIKDETVTIALIVGAIRAPQACPAALS